MASSVERGEQQIFEIGARFLVRSKLVLLDVNVDRVARKDDRVFRNGGAICGTGNYGVLVKKARQLCKIAGGLPQETGGCWASGVAARIFLETKSCSRSILGAGAAKVEGASCMAGSPGLTFNAAFNSGGRNNLEHRSMPSSWSRRSRQGRLVGRPRQCGCDVVPRLHGSGTPGNRLALLDVGSD